MIRWRATFLAAMALCPLLSACSMIEVEESSSPVPVVGRMLRRAYRTDVPLVKDGRAACAIICPAEPGPWRELAEELAQAIRGLGADDVPIVLDTEAVPERLGPLRSDLQSKSLILLGDLNTNRACFAFYASYYTCADAR